MHLVKERLSKRQLQFSLWKFLHTFIINAICRLFWGNLQIAKNLKKNRSKIIGQNNSINFLNVVVRVQQKLCLDYVTNSLVKLPGLAYPQTLIRLYGLRHFQIIFETTHLR